MRGYASWSYVIFSSLQIIECIFTFPEISRGAVASLDLPWYDIITNNLYYKFTIKGNSA